MKNNPPKNKRLFFFDISELDFVLLWMTEQRQHTHNVRSTEKIVCLEESKNDDLICVCKSDFLFSSPFLNHSPTRLFYFPSKTTERKTRRNNVMDRPGIVCLCVRPTEYCWKKRPKIDRSRQQFSSSDGCYNLRGVRYYILHKTEEKERLFFLFLFGLETIITNHKKKNPPTTILW